MIRIILIFICMLSLKGNFLHAQDNQATRKKHFNTQKSLAIKGYDPVSYFLEKNGVKGKSSLMFNHGGVIYFFSSQEHLELFKKNPTAYEPQYGGWCAYAMGNTGEKVEVDPETFKIINGKLYLYYNKYLTNTLKSWNKNEGNLLKQANLNWNKIFKEL